MRRMTTAKTLRILGIVATVTLVIVGCYWPLAIAWLIVMMGGLTQRGMTLRPQAASGFLGAILSAIAIVTVGVLIIRKLARGIVRGRPVHSFSRPRPTSLAPHPHRDPSVFISRLSDAKPSTASSSPWEL